MNGCATPAVIMVIDDVPANVKLLGEILRSCGYEVRDFTDGAQALAAAAVSPPDLVLLDISMPGLDGYTVCKRLKTDEKLAGIPVLFISALGEALDKVQAFKVGGVDYITKPFEIEEVLARVDTHLKLSCAQRELECKNGELTENYNRLRELESLRDSLVHMIVHDLRNPLAAVSGFLEILQMSEAERLSEKGRGYVQRIARSTDALMELINSVLDVSKMEAGRMELNLEGCDLGSIAREACSRLETLKGARQLTLEAPEEPAIVTGDAQLLSRLVQNLAGNALKYTPQTEGAVVLCVHPEESRVRVTVQDNGNGIAPEHLGKVFDKFWQGEARKKGQIASTGLGLTFCKMVVEAHGGTIGVESEVGRGSTFWFELPRGGPEAGAPVKRDQPER